MSVSSISGGASAVSKLQAPKGPKPQPKKVDADGDHDGTTASQADAEKSGKIDVKG
jgi:hypothetical protein